MVDAPEAITVESASKQYVKYDDAPTLIGRIMRRPRRSTVTKLWAVRDASFAVGRGECVGVIGRNGSGKSTLLRLLAGVTAPTEGSVWVRGRVAPLIAVGVGFHPELTGRENVYVNGTVLGLSRGQIDDRFAEIVEFADIGPFIDTPVKFYSSGMFVRLGFSVAVLAEPEILLVDEVLAVGDLAFQLRCFDKMMEIRAAGTTIVVVSHNLNAVRMMCERTLVLHNGELRYDGSTNEAISLYHELLGERREPESAQAVRPRDAPAVDAAGVVDRFDLLGPDGAPTHHLASTETGTFVLDVTFHRHVEDPIVGFAIYNEAGIEAYRTTTPWRGEGSYVAGTRARFSVRLRPSLATGSYTAHLLVVSGAGVSYTQIPRPLLFYVSGRPEVTGVADLGAVIETSQEAQSER